MRGLVSAINLLNTGFAYVINLALSSVITDPHLVWDFGGPAIVGGFVTVLFVSRPMPHKYRFFADSSIVLPVPPHRQGGIRLVYYADYGEP